MAISGRLFADVRRYSSGCSGLLEVDRIDARRVEGRTELRQRSEPRQLITGTWLGFKPSVPQRRWLLKHGAGARFVGL